jgi:hypothetical protein
VASTGQVFTVTASKARALLTEARAERVNGNGLAATYVSKSRNQTFNLFDAGPGKIKVQVMSGCVC